MQTESQERCPECGAAARSIEGPTHAYVPATAGCWALFGEVQADELMRFGYPPAHDLVVHAYFAQHPGDGDDRRARQSLFIHLVGLCAMLERGFSAKQAKQALSDALMGRPDFPHLRRANGPGLITVEHMVGAVDLHDYGERAKAWAQAVWASWAESHPLIRDYLARLRGR
jgi:hypothetical protein